MKARCYYFLHADYFHYYYMLFDIIHFDADIRHWCHIFFHIFSRLLLIFFLSTLFSLMPTFSSSLFSLFHYAIRHVDVIIIKNFDYYSFSLLFSLLLMKDMSFIDLLRVHMLLFRPSILIFFFFYYYFLRYYFDIIIDAIIIILIIIIIMICDIKEERQRSIRERKSAEREERELLSFAIIDTLLIIFDIFITLIIIIFDADDITLLISLFYFDYADVYWYFIFMIFHYIFIIFFISIFSSLLFFPLIFSFIFIIFISMQRKKERLWGKRNLYYYYDMFLLFRFFIIIFLSLSFFLIIFISMPFSIISICQDIFVLIMILFDIIFIIIISLSRWLHITWLCWCYYHDIHYACSFRPLLFLHFIIFAFIILLYYEIFHMLLHVHSVHYIIMALFSIFKIYT